MTMLEQPELHRGIQPIIYLIETPTTPEALPFPNMHRGSLRVTHASRPALADIMGAALGFCYQPRSPSKILQSFELIHSWVERPRIGRDAY
jgi:hypothetical protein